jgi:hypothetical protein
MSSSLSQMRGCWMPAPLQAVIVCFSKTRLCVLHGAGAVLGSLKAAPEAQGPPRCARLLLCRQHGQDVRLSNIRLPVTLKPQLLLLVSPWNI